MFDVSFGVNAELFSAAVIRLLQTVITFGAMLPSGLFIPSLFIGASVGRLTGNMVFFVLQQQHVEPGVFAMVGAAAMLSGFTRLTVSLVVIMFELTGELTYVIPFMCSVITAKVVGDLFTPSIYEAHASLNGFANIEDPPTSVRLEVLVADLAVHYPWERVLDVDEYMTFRELRELVNLPAPDDFVIETSDSDALGKKEVTGSFELEDGVVAGAARTEEGYNSAFSPSSGGKTIIASRRKTTGGKSSLAQNPLGEDEDQQDESSSSDEEDHISRGRGRGRRGKRGTAEDRRGLLGGPSSGGGNSKKTSDGDVPSSSAVMVSSSARRFSANSVILVRRGVGPIFGVIRKRRLREWVSEMALVEDSLQLEERLCCFALYSGDGLWAENIEVRAQAGLGRVANSPDVVQVTRSAETGRVRPPGLQQMVIGVSMDNIMIQPGENSRTVGGAGGSTTGRSWKEKPPRPLKEFDKEKGRFTKMGVVSPVNAVAPSSGGVLDRRLVVLPADRVPALASNLQSEASAAGSSSGSPTTPPFRSVPRTREGSPGPSASAITREHELPPAQTSSGHQPGPSGQHARSEVGTPPPRGGPMSSLPLPGQAARSSSFETPTRRRGSDGHDLDENQILAEDISFLVDTHIAKLAMDASMLTLFCVFHQNPELRYIVCTSKRELNLGVISRAAFINALCEQNLAHPPVHRGIDDVALENAVEDESCLWGRGGDVVRGRGPDGGMAGAGGRGTV